MREADRRTIDGGVPSLFLMERAGRAVVDAMVSEFPDLASRRVVVISGRGSNGGDGFVAARLLGEQRVRVTVVLVGRQADLTGDARAVFARLGEQPVDVREAPDDRAWLGAAPSVRSADIVVDALVGTGLTRPLSGLLARVVHDINGTNARVVAIDLPSGVAADRSDLIGPAVQAALTVTLGAPKVALVQWPSEGRAGRVVVADIGIPADVIDTLDGPRTEVLDGDVARRWMPARSRSAHKGDFGHVLVVAGSPGKTGAASLAALGALRSGAGLVTVACPASSAPVVSTLGREYMTFALPEADGNIVAAEAVALVLAFGADVVAVGPGLGRTAGVQQLVRELVTRSEQPLVLDADAIQAFAGDARALRAHAAPLVLTPHPGEMAALLGRPVAEIQASRLDTARTLAADVDATVVLKGARTVVAGSNGRVFVNSTGNPGMATAGSGDVLTGAVAAWVAQRPSPHEAAALAVFLHGRAGDLAAADEGEVGLVAGDVLANLGRAARTLAGGATVPPEP